MLVGFNEGGGKGEGFQVEKCEKEFLFCFLSFKRVFDIVGINLFLICWKESVKLYRIVKT